MSHIEFNAEVAKINADAINMAKSAHPDFKGAHEAFEHGLNILENKHDTTALGNRLQQARLICDDGVVDARHALYTGVQESQPWESPSLFDKAIARVGQSSFITRGLLDARRVDPEVWAALPAIKAHDGATKGVMGRIVLSRQVLQGRYGPEAIAEQYWFGRAQDHGQLKDGNNAYWRVSNAMHGARAEYINKRYPHMVPWLGRAVVGFASPEDRVQAAKTAVRVGQVIARGFVPGGRERVLQAAVDYRLL